jgi:hypothetical protein
MPDQVSALYAVLLRPEEEDIWQIQFWKFLKLKSRFGQEVPCARTPASPAKSRAMAPKYDKHLLIK